MQTHRQEPVRAATRRMRRGKKASRRILVSALNAFHQIDEALAPDVVEPPVLRPALRVYPGSRAVTERIAAAR
jgi:hypothetical protein